MHIFETLKSSTKKLFFLILAIFWNIDTHFHLWIKVISQFFVVIQNAIFLQKKTFNFIAFLPHFKPHMSCHTTKTHFIIPFCFSFCQSILYCFYSVCVLACFQWFFTCKGCQEENQIRLKTPVKLLQYGSTKITTQYQKMVFVRN